MTLLVALVRLVLAGVFVVSAVAKLRDRAGSHAGVQAFGVPQPLVGVVATCLPIAELTCAALLLLADPAATVGAIGSLVLLLAFTTAIIINLLRGRRPECHCFGSMGDQGGIGWDTVARNGVLFVLAGVSLIGAGSLRSVPAELTDLSLAQAGLLVAAVLVVAALVTMGMALRTLIARYGAVLLRLESVEQATGLTAPKPAPDFTLPDLDGEHATLDDVLDDGRPALLVFISPTCHNCTELLPDLSAWQSDSEHPLNVVVISDGSVAENRVKLAGVGPLRVLLQKGLATSDAYGIQGTPAAALVGADGRLAGPPAHAVEGVRNLHDSVLATMSAGPASAADHQHVHSIQPRPVSEGDPLPAVALRSEDDTEVHPVNAIGEDAVLLFWRSDCGFCQQILNDVRELESSTPLRLITGSDVATLRDSGLTSPVLRDVSGALEQWLQVPGTPSAARIRDGVLGSSVAVGGPEVLELLRSTVATAAIAE